MPRVQLEEFAQRHIGICNRSKEEMLAVIGEANMDSFIDKVIPKNIRLLKSLKIPSAISEQTFLQEMKACAEKNECYKNYMGQGYYGTFTPSVIHRNIFENPGWYTQYTPYQAEIAQGRLESLLHFQTMIVDLTGLEIANASLLDEATAAAEAMLMLYQSAIKTHPHKNSFFVDDAIFPQTKDVIHTRAKALDITLVYGDYKKFASTEQFFGALVQYPNDSGTVEDYRRFIADVHTKGVEVVMAVDLLSLTLLTPPGELGATVAIGSSQRFGVPMGYGGPHAAFFATRASFTRFMPGRIIGVSIDAKGNKAYRMSLQTREQHIKREKATSNICTAQALLANMAVSYAIYHGPTRLKQIARTIHQQTQVLYKALQELKLLVHGTTFFDTLKITIPKISSFRKLAEKQKINFRYYDDGCSIGVSIDETTTEEDVQVLINLFESYSGKKIKKTNKSSAQHDLLLAIPSSLVRSSNFLTHPTFNTYHDETQLMRYLKQLENKDLSLNRTMISLGSCTMKLNAASEMIPLSWSNFAHIHPFVPKAQVQGYQEIIESLSNYLCTITGFYACSLQPNSGAQGELTGLLTIKNYHEYNKHQNRHVILIPISAHGTNPASAVLANLKVVTIDTDSHGHINFKDLQEKVLLYKNDLFGMMITYPSTFGVFDEEIQEITNLIHQYGGLIYLDGANMNAQVGLTNPAQLGADVCHLNLHKTFAIPHGGGGPGMGPICCNKLLAKFLPKHFQTTNTDEKKTKATNYQNRAVAASEYGSALVLLISYGYIRMLGNEGLKHATEYAILNANYMRKRLLEHYPILYKGKNGFCAHEFIVDCRAFKHTANIEVEDIAKRLIDYGFHAPTVSFPIPGTLMIEPTESENKEELDRFCDAMITIRKEIRDIEEGRVDKIDNVLKNAPHTIIDVASDQWQHGYSRAQACFPLPYLYVNKFWASVNRVNNTHGDRNLICTCMSNIPDNH
ncbi:MAG: aminomethyl-transferring glycine dehydrogenase [Phycisphaerales bacterium]|nr:aminomethyl-transferring glycine dehydrogenase [Phycisphaerales bacterium]